MDDLIFYTKFGFTHVLDWNAYDHVLFFIVLTIFYSFKDWKKALGLITFFTIAHTLTLLLSAYNFIYIKQEVVEFLIPSTILLTAIYNIIFVKKSFKNFKISFLFAFFFGLIHGLGFSSSIRILIDDTEDKLLPILEFAMGIEIAQIIVVLFIFLFNFIILNVFKRKKRDWIIIISSITIGIVIPMLIERKFW
ncbi:MAG: HupE/UreJ family protein [Flavobacteriaceae bacterium]|nr:HupE/UreJ family protein [Flavobacteriaceae bacterium]